MIDGVAALRQEAYRADRHFFQYFQVSKLETLHPV